MTDSLPPWEPIADWLARLPERDCDSEHEDTRLAQNSTEHEARKRYERTAKAIAYDIATTTDEMAAEATERMKRESPNHPTTDCRTDVPNDLK